MIVAIARQPRATQSDIGVVNRQDAEDAKLPEPDLGAFPDSERGRGRDRGRGRATQPSAQMAEISHMHERDEGVFGFDKLDAYQRAVEFVAAAAGIISELPSGYSSLSDQLRRAALCSGQHRRRRWANERRRSQALLRDRARFGNGMRCNSRCVQSPIGRKSDPSGGGSFTPAANRADAEEVVPLIVHVHGHVHGHVQNGICTRFEVRLGEKE